MAVEIKESSTQLVLLAPNLEPKEVYEFLTSDFEDVWNSVAWSPSARGRGNFMFAILAMAFLEFACRLCKSDEQALLDFSKQLMKIDPRYFRHIEGLSAGTGSEFTLPYIEAEQTDDLVLCALFDLIRNGLAHQYQQVVVELKGGRYWGMTLTGPSLGRYLQSVGKVPRTESDHLTLNSDRDGCIWLTVDPARLFLDFKKAFEESRLLERELKVENLVRPDSTHGKRYDFDTDALESALPDTTSTRAGLR